MSRGLRILLALWGILGVGGCADGGTGIPDPGGPAGGMDLDALFSAATPAEIAEVEAQWATRDPGVEGVQVQEELPFLLGPSTGTVRIVSHLVDGLTHYGAIITPPGAEAGSLPILVYAHGGAAGISLTELQLIGAVLGDRATKMVFVVPSFRGEELSFGDLTFQSQGDRSPWDRDVDDALALLEVALATTPEVDPNRIGVLGFSRGAGVALLMAVRDPRVSSVVEFFGPTDFLGVFVRELIQDALDGQPVDLPGFDDLNRDIIQPFRQGRMTLDQIRLELIRRSAVLWAPSLPNLQIHHGQLDEDVPVSQAEALIMALTAAGRTEPGFQYFIYPNGRHDPFTLGGALGRTEAFLTQTLGLPPSAVTSTGPAFSWERLPATSGSLDPKSFSWSWTRRSP